VTTTEQFPIPENRRWQTSLRNFSLRAIVQDRIFKKIYPGIMHLLIFWGMTIQILGTIINLLQYPLFTPFVIDWPRDGYYLGFELIMDIAGIMIVVGVIMAVIRRTVFRPSYMVNRWDDWYSLGLLVLISLLGFASEAVRLQTMAPNWRAWSPVGNLLAGWLSTTGISGEAVNTIHLILFWLHAATGMLFLVSLPFTKLRHMIAGPLNIVLRPQRSTGALEAIADIETTEKLGAGKIEEFQSLSLLMFDACVQCGRCEDVCPSTISGMPYSPRVLLEDLHLTLKTTLTAPENGKPLALLGEAIQKETPWLCTTCAACLEACPLMIDPVRSAVELRRYLTLTTGEVPNPVGEALTQMERRGNPWGLPKEDHAPWVQELGVRVLQPGEETDVLLFVGCAYGYDNRGQQSGADLVRLLQSADVDFAVLGAAEGCCGETARRLGHEYLFQVMAQENIETFKAVRFKRIVSACAHCYNTLKNEYPQFGGEYLVQHHSELLAELLEAGKIQTRAADNGQVFSYHDSCYLGRINQLYSEPRKTLDRVEGLKQVEFERRKVDGFCCGGGGGHMWMEIDPNTRINHQRLAEAVKIETDVVVTACPYCLIMLDDAIRSKGLGEEMAVKDIAEVLASHSEIQKR
jgi:Fe-S oxidoreductase/nitrate reductase gamma subunit